ncbi:MAG TPA: TolC family protein [Acidobacteria bacterium]|nr:TolC family protein [Acidobacteriota bacterium]
MATRIIALTAAALTALILAVPAPAQQEKPPGAAPEGATVQGTDLVPAEPAGPLHLSLDEAVAQALEANPGLRALAHRSAAAERSARAAARTRWGQLDAFFNYTRYNDDWIVRPMSQQMFEEASGFADLPWDRNQRHYGLTFQIPLYMGGELTHGIQVRQLEADKTAALLRGSHWQVRFNAVSLYAGIQTLDAMGDALDELIRSLETTRQRLNLMVETGKRPELDRLKVIEELEDARAQRASIRADRVKVAALLLALMGRDPSGEVVTDPLPDRIPEAMMTRQELRAAVQESSAILQARFTAEQSEHGVRVAASSFIPKVVARGNLTQNAAPSLDDPLDTWQVSVGVVVPIFHGTSRFEELAAAKEQRSAAQEKLVQTQMEAGARLEEALARFDSARAELRAARARVTAGTEAARIEQIRYDTGAGTIEDLLRAQSRQQSARASLARALGTVVTAAQRINSIVEKEALR